MSIEIKQKIKEVADDFGMPAKSLIEIVGRFYDKPKSSSQNLTEDQLNVIFDYITAQNQIGSIAEVFPDAAYQRCTVHFYRNALAKVPKSKRPKAAAMLKAIHAMESREASEAKALEVADELDSMRLKEAAKVVRDGYAETLTYTRFPREHWRRIRTNNAIERLNREIRRRTRVVGTFPDGKSALMLVTARLKYVAESEWGSRRYLDVTLLEG